MSSAWLLPEHIADVLPSQARRVEDLRRQLLDKARTYGFELIIPPLLEHLDSLLSGTGHALDLQTFKLVDQLSGRTLGLRADTTPQAARIDAHLLNRAGVTRLCYCGPVLHTRPAAPHASREPLQFGAEIFGHAGLEADLEVQELALDALRAAGAKGMVIDMAHAGVVRGLLSGAHLAASELNAIVAALASKDHAAIAQQTQGLPDQARAALAALLRLYGGQEVLQAARHELPDTPAIRCALEDLQWLASHIQVSHPDVSVGFDLADVGGYAYYSGARFGIFGEAGRAALARGGRYDEVGAVFGRSRPAVGFSLDLKNVAEQLAGQLAVAPGAGAVRSPWGEEPELRQAIRRLRELGETVVCMLPGHEHEAQEFEFDRELIQVNGRWACTAVDANKQGQ